MVKSHGNHPDVNSSNDFNDSFCNSSYEETNNEREIALRTP